MSILSRLTYSLEVKLNTFLQAFEFEQLIENPELASRRFTRNLFCEDENSKPRCYIGHLIETLKFMGQLRIPFRGH